MKKYEIDEFDKNDNDFKESLKKSDKDFVKLYRRSFPELGELAKENGTALCILLFLIRHMDRNNAIIIKQDIIAEYVKLSRQTVSKQLKYLDANGWIQIIKHGREIIYIVNDYMAWTSYGHQHWNCGFDQMLKHKMFDNDTWNIKKKSNAPYVKRVE